MRGRGGGQGVRWWLDLCTNVTSVVNEHLNFLFGNSITEGHSYWAMTNVIERDIWELPTKKLF